MHALTLRWVLTLAPVVPCSGRDHERFCFLEIYVDVALVIVLSTVGAANAERVAVGGGRRVGLVAGATAVVGVGGAHLRDRAELANRRAHRPTTVRVRLLMD